MRTKSVQNNSASTAVAKKPWKPGLLAQFPWLGVAAIIGALAGLAASVAILVYSNDKPLASWRYQPSTYLSIASTIGNICMGFALKEGANVAWWRRSLKDKTSIADLHRYWSHGSFLSALLAGKHISWLATATIVATIAQFNGPLLQRASRVIVRQDVSQTTVQLRLVPSLPFGFSGFVSGRAYYASLFTTPFSDIVQDWNIQAPISFQGSGCQGTCGTRVTGVGFATNCSSYTLPFDLNPSEPFNASTDPAVVNGTTAFETNYFWAMQIPGNISLSVAAKETSDCQGFLRVTNCTLQQATVQYQVIIDGNASTISLDPSTTVFDDVVDQIVPVLDPLMDGPTTLGGFGYALSNRYDSAAHLRFVGAVGYELISTGNMATQYANLTGITESYSLAPASSCNLSFRDPLADLLAGARELMFRSSLAAANASVPVQILPASQSLSRPIYHTNYVYLGVATAVVLFALTLIAATFWGYNVLGRKFSMSPLETAKAFNPPLLRSADSNAPIKDLIKEVGDREIRYGAVLVTTGGKPTPSNGESQEPGTPRTDHEEVGPAARVRLEMADRTVVQSPRVGWTFEG
ncbi:hypothetical protein CLAIMM_06769 [Cladophialophora immunda]|nr:hypothetical protein CLAIMM_06769 [Cladophialophora immunda]